MIYTNCSCGEPIILGWESGDPMGFYRTNCECGQIAMSELTSLGGQTTILANEQELEEFVMAKRLNKPSKPSSINVQRDLE